MFKPSRASPLQDLLLNWRLYLGLSQRAMAELLGTTQATLCRWERGTVVLDDTTKRGILAKMQELMDNPPRAGVDRLIVRATQLRRPRVAIVGKKAAKKTAKIKPRR